MFAHLTKYLLLYRQMDIPAIGAFRLVSTPASLNTEDQVIYPPSFVIEFNRNDSVKDHQLSYLASNLQCNEASARHELEAFADKLKNKLHHGPFVWAGVGTLELEGDSVNFHQVQSEPALLEPVPATKVLHDRTQKVVTSGSEVEGSPEEDIEVSRRKPKTAIIIGWVLIILSIAFIVFHFYKNGLKPSSSGNQMKIKVEKGV